MVPGSPGKGTTADREVVGAKRDKSGVGWWMQNPEAIFHGTSHDASTSSLVPRPFNVPLYFSLPFAKLTVNSLGV